MAKLIRFGIFEVDTRTGELRKQGLRVRLQEQPFRVLCLLVSQPGELVTRDELRSKLWSADTFVDFEHGLNKAMSKLREALVDDSDTPRYIETLPRRGYRFIAPVTGTKPPEHSAKPQQAPEAAMETPPHQAEIGLARRARWLAPVLVLLLLVLAFPASSFLYRLFRKHAASVGSVSAAPIRSLAVLPLQNLSGDKNQEYFADGMTDELITDLAQMSELRVISRTSVMHYKGTTEKLPQIGRELGADAVVEGTVFRAGGRVRITAQLIDARTDRHIWARQYERDLKDVLSLQDDVARDIADEIRVELTPQERARLSASRAVNPEAHEAYLEGRYFWNQFTEVNTKKSLGFFRQAISDDPNYALGYSGLADYYGVMYIRFGLLPRDEACPKGEAAALKAVELGPSLAETHHSLAALRLYCDWDISGAESEFKRAIAVNPNYSEAHRVYAALLTYSGRHREALAEMARALENDPMSVDINLISGWIDFEARHYDQAVRQYRKTIEMDPNRAGVLFGLGDVYAQQGRFDLAIGSYRKAVALSGGRPAASSALAYAYALAGKRAKAIAILKRMNGEPSRQLPTTLSPAFARATAYLALGDKRHALAWIERGYENHEDGMLSLKVDPRFDPLRSDPRFQALVQRIGL